MQQLKKWISEQKKYKEELNKKYRELAERGEPLYDDRILFGAGYLEALNDICQCIFYDVDINHISNDILERLANSLHEREPSLFKDFTFSIKEVHILEGILKDILK